MNKMYYKVVKRTKDPNTFTSAIAKDRLCLEYRIGEWTNTPKFLSQSGLYSCVFTTDYAAEAWKNSIERMGFSSDLTVLLCEGKDQLETLPRRLKNPSLKYRSRLLVFLQLIFTGSSPLSWPYFTVMVKKLRPIKMV